MSAETTVIAVAIALTVMFSAAFILHNIEQNRKERIRIQSTLKKQAANLLYMLERFPPTFLGSDLKTLICKGLIDIYGRLARTNPSEKHYRTSMKAIQARLLELQNSPAKPGHEPLKNPAQILEIKKLLEMLHRFIGRLLKEKVIGQQHATLYTNQLRKLLTRTSVDHYVMAATKAENQEQYRLSIHYYQISLSKIANEKLEEDYRNHIPLFNARIEELTQMSNAQMQESADSAISLSEQWTGFVEERESWQKGLEYD